MRKITLLMGLFLSLLGVAQVSAQDYRYSGYPISTQQELTSGRYLISVHCKGKEGLLYWSNSGTETSFSVSSTTASSKTSSTMTASGDDAKYMWDIVVDNEGNFTIQSVSSKYYTSKRGKDAEGKHNVLYVSAGDANIGKHQLQSSVTISDIPHFTVKLANGYFNGDGSTTTYFHCNGDGLGMTGNHMHLSYWSGENTSTASGNTCVKMAFYRLTPESETSTFTYDYQINGVSKKTEQHVAGIGAAFPNLASLPAFCTGTKPEGTVSAGDNNTTKVINVTWNGPFNYSSTVGDAKWYLMTLAKVGTNLPVVRYNPEHQYITLEQGDNTFTYAKNDQWAFVGNPFDGFKIYNRALPGGRLISSTTMSDGQGRTTRPYVSADELPSGYTETWDIHLQEWNQQNQTKIPGGFAISQHGTPANKMNRRAQTENNGNQSDFCIAYWTGGSDNGSTFTVSQASLPNITLNTVNGTSYASFYVDYPVVVTSDNVKVYTGTKNGNSLEMTEAGDNIIPANVGVVLISESGATTAEISISNEDGTLKPSSLTGTTSPIDISSTKSNYLVLGRDKDDLTKVGFYRPSGTQIPAYKAYIHLGGGNVQGLAFNFDGATTDINSISATTDKQEIYDLSGRRVMKANKGLYIINGKKCFIK